MRILTNENISGVAVDELRRRDHDVLWALVHMPGSSDTEVLRRAESQNRTLLTFDKDFGELAFVLDWRLPLGLSCFESVSPIPPTSSERW